MLGVALTVASIPLPGLAGQLTVGNAVNEIVIVAGYLGVGAVVARRQPWNPIGPRARARVGMGRRARPTPGSRAFPGRSVSRYTLLT